MGSEVIAICNAATREVRFLPDVPHDGEDFICSIGFEREENKYKVVLTIETNGKLSRAWETYLVFALVGLSIGLALLRTIV
ncbi:hypothetical protein KY290_024602 [Solanum tuberosum]|uniref:Uncharacterized protein n=1 Tax=Solanum tuberosum TaxID=4113 RepID=A0ABQ7UR54_SOLTU|nr:hypothetical protein KY284_023450 [Solanum tuberosum]KAH0754332.1 hypothetical protein KY290_024602 [Solanum tuberosum]